MAPFPHTLCTEPELRAHFALSTSPNGVVAFRGPRTVPANGPLAPWRLAATEPDAPSFQKWSLLAPTEISRLGRRWAGPVELTLFRFCAIIRTNVPKPGVHTASESLFIRNPLEKGCE